MNHRSLFVATNVVCALLLLLLPSAAVAAPLFRVGFDSFTDIDLDGRIDCGEPVRFRASVAETRPSTSVSGSILIPSGPTDNWVFQRGTVDIDYALNAGCIPQIVEGNAIGDTSAQVDYTCSTGSPPNDGYALAFYVTGRYIGDPAAGTTMVVPATHTQGSLTQTAQGIANGTFVCGGTLDVSLRKSDGGVTASPGSLVSYTLTMSNQGFVSATGVTLTDTVPAHTTFEPASSSPGWSCPGGTAAGSICTLSEGTLPLGASVARIFAVRVNIPAGTTLITNNATVLAPGDAVPANNSASDTTPVDPGSPDITLTKTLSSGSGVPGSVNVYSLTVRNVGVATADGVALSETIPPYTRFDSAASSAGWSCSPSINPGATCALSVGSLTPGAAQSATFALRIDSTLPAAATSVTNTACSATSTTGDPTANNCSTITTPLGGAPSLSLTKTLSSGTATPGATLTWSLTLRNTGNREAAAPTLRETVPAQTTFSAGASSAGWACTPGPAAGSTCTLALPSLAAGAQVSRSFAVTIANPLPSGVTEVSNTACATDPAASQVCDTIRHPTDASPALVTTKTLLSGSGQPGSLLTYRISVSNVGNQAASTVTLTDVVPDHTTFEAGSSSLGWHCTPGTAAGSTCTASLGSLAGGGASASRDFAVRIVQPLPAGVTVITNRACASAPSVQDNCDNETTPTTGSPVLAIVKKLLTANPGPGTLLSYEITVTNSGDQDAASVTVTDELPPATAFDPASSSPGWSCSPSNHSPATCSATVSPLAAGASATLLLGARLDAPLPAGLEVLPNTACVEQGAQRSCSSISTPLGDAPLLQVVKTYDDGPLTAGKLLPFHIALTNAGDQDSAALVVTETVPDHSSFVALASTPGWVCAAETTASACAFPVASLRVGEIRDLVFAVRAADPLPAGVSQIANAACLVTSDGSTCDDTSTPLRVAVELLLADSLEADADANGLAGMGDTLRYTLTFTNSSASAAEALTISLELDTHVGLIPGSVFTDLGDVAAGNDTGDTTVVLTIPRLEPGATGTASFQVLIGSVQGLDHLVSRALVSGTNFADEPSDDPDTPEDDDPTVTPLGPTTPLHEVPTLDSVGLLLLSVGLALLGIRFARFS
jgi:uncharacterized repeat protein (TIGR01451 family)